MHAGKERDGVFIDEHSINVYEFTCDRSKAKARKDGDKLREILADLSRLPEHRYKSSTGYFVTELEPTAEQRSAIETIANSQRVNIKCLSITALRNTLVDVEDYIAKRLVAPFGSTSFQLPIEDGLPPFTRSGYIEPTFRAATVDTPASLADLVSALSTGEHIALTGDFGIGKSAALRELFVRLRKLYFRNPTARAFPVHINLRDCSGLKTPREIMQRHAEDIGFAGANGLISAWRAGQTILLLDGFDELIPARWVGSARDLSQVRWQALAPIRHLIEQSPPGSGILVSGRPQYFTTAGELERCLGLEAAEIFDLQDFDEQQLGQYIGDQAYFPAWLPPRPLLVEFLIRRGIFEDPEARAQATPGEGWVHILELIASREAKRVTSIPAETFLRLISRVSLVARSVSDGRGPVTLHDMQRAFYDVCGYEAEEEGLQALLRLPGLVSEANGAEDEMRSFVDRQLADAGYGYELATYLTTPYQGPLSSAAAWATASSDLAASVAVGFLSKWEFDPGVVVGAYKKRSGDQFFDAVLHDICVVSDTIHAPTRSATAPFIADVLIPRLEIFSSPDSLLARATYQGCVIEVLDVTDHESGSPFPHFSECAIGRIEGWSAFPPALSGNFKNSDVEAFAAHSETTAGIMTLDLDLEDRIALSILKKLYGQAGTARRLSALSRGLPLEDRPWVGSALEKLRTAGFLTMADGKGEALVVPVRSKRAEVAGLLRAPANVAAALSRS